MMYELGVVYRNIRRADADIAAKLGACGSAAVHEAMGRTGLMKSYMRPVYAGSQASGTAVTVVATAARSALTCAAVKSWRSSTSGRAFDGPHLARSPSPGRTLWVMSPYVTSHRWIRDPCTMAIS